MEKIGKMFNRGKAFDARRIPGFDPFAFAGGAGGKTTISYRIAKVLPRQPAVFQRVPKTGRPPKPIPAGGIWGKIGFSWRAMYPPGTTKRVWYQTGWLDWWLKSEKTQWKKSKSGVSYSFLPTTGYQIPGTTGTSSLAEYKKWVKSLPKIGMKMPGAIMEYGFKDWGPY